MMDDFPDRKDYAGTPGRRGVRLLLKASATREGTFFDFFFKPPKAKYKVASLASAGRRGGRSRSIGESEKSAEEAGVLDVFSLWLPHPLSECARVAARRRRGLVGLLGLLRLLRASPEETPTLPTTSAATTAHSARRASSRHHNLIHVVVGVGGGEL